VADGLSKPFLRKTAMLRRRGRLSANIIGALGLDVLVQTRNLSSGAKMTNMRDLCLAFLGIKRARNHCRMVIDIDGE
jgi:hypothetical protein